jgi:hypothetical protein
LLLKKFRCFTGSCNKQSTEEAELFRYLSSDFGFAKVGKQIDTVRYVVDTAVEQGKVRENNRIKVVDK